MKFIDTVITIIFALSLGFFIQSANAQQEVKTNDLNLTAEQCKTLGGIWNECPPNECQKTIAYQKGEVMCPQVCGEPQCEGLVPSDEEDLSNVHNIDLDHQPIIRGQDVTEDQPQEPLLETKQKQEEPSKQEMSESLIKLESTGEKMSRLGIYLVLGFILILVFVVLKYKSRQ